MSQDDWTYYDIDTDNSFGFATVYFTDVDLDGDKDVLAASNGQGASGTIAYFKNNGGLTANRFDKPAAPGTPDRYTIDYPVGPISYISAADFNGDGIEDIFAAYPDLYDPGFDIEWKGMIAWWKGDGSGNFGPRSSISLFSQASTAITTDIDNDGDPDICSAAFERDKISCWQNNLKVYGP